MLNLYLSNYLSSEGDNGSGRGSLFKRPQKITVNDISEDVIREAAKKTEGFSGREIAKAHGQLSMDALIVFLIHSYLVRL